MKEAINIQFQPTWRGDFARAYPVEVLATYL
jgi:hypothetical protein